MTDTPKASEPSAYLKTLEDVRHFVDVPMEIAVHLGERTMKIREILQLVPGSIVELPRSAGENIDVYINGRLIGYGEVLDMEGRTGIRLTDVWSPK